MQPDRREFLKRAGCLMAAGSGGLVGSDARGNGHPIDPLDLMGVLVDLTECVGCRLCEHACQLADGLDPGPVESYDDQSVFAIKRRPGPVQLTVLNSWPGPPTGAQTQPQSVYAKVNCLHCNHASCVSACIVGALEKQPDGAVTYDAWKCIGCRYCMVACPFQIPAYEYDRVLTPRVRKCDFCHERTNEGKPPACVEACPRQVMVYGKRSELVRLAHERIAKHPDKYVNHVYGEHEVGGTSWMYLSTVPFEQAGFLTLGTAAPPALTEAIQHGVFKYWIAPIGWYSLLSFITWKTGRKQHQRAETGESHAHEIERAAPARRSLNTWGVWTLVALVISGVAFGLYRFIFGLAASTNLDQQHPWGLWIAMDVGSGIALAGGGFVTAALVHIFHREHYHDVARSALLTALLGYTFYVPGLLADIGRWYNIWHPTLPNMWQGNSVLFEVGICVMLYLNVQYLELTPIVCERMLGKDSRLSRWAGKLHRVLEWMMPAFLVAGVTLSTFHQSSLGNLMVIAPWKLHELWWTPVSPLLFLFSAMMVGFPMVIFTLLFASWALKRKPQMDVLGPLSLYATVFLGIYLILKVVDVIWRGAYGDITSLAPLGISWLAEMIVGVAIPLGMILSPRVRRSPRLLGVACLAVILGVVLNRLNCFVLGYFPPFAERSYFPSITEFAVSAGLVAALMLTYRVAVTYLPILPAEKEAHA